MTTLGSYPKATEEGRAPWDKSLLFYHSSVSGCLPPLKAECPDYCASHSVNSKSHWVRFVLLAMAAGPSQPPEHCIPKRFIGNAGFFKPLFKTDQPGLEKWD